METKPLIVVVGETASGKSNLAMQIAEQHDGEIICADSRTVYKGMDIGTAKPSLADQRAVPHHLLDLVEPGQAYSAAAFKQAALNAIDDIASRGKLPVMVGGSGLYIDAVIFDYKFGQVDVAKRAELNMLSLAELHERAHRLGIKETEVDFANRRHLQRAVEAGKVLKNKQHLRPNTLVLGLKLDGETLKERIAHRLDAMMGDGLVAEVAVLGKKYGWENEAMRGTGYRFFGEYIRGEVSLEEAKARFVQGDISLAKRQRTWFRRNPFIQWFDAPEAALTVVKQFLKPHEQ